MTRSMRPTGPAGRILGVAPLLAAVVGLGPAFMSAAPAQAASPSAGTAGTVPVVTVPLDTAAADSIHILGAAAGSVTFEAEAGSSFAEFSAIGTGAVAAPACHDNDKIVGTKTMQVDYSDPQHQTYTLCDVVTGARSTATGVPGAVDEVGPLNVGDGWLWQDHAAHQVVHESVDSHQVMRLAIPDGSALVTADSTQAVIVTNLSGDPGVRLSLMRLSDGNLTMLGEYPGRAMWQISDVKLSDHYVVWADPQTGFHWWNRSGGTPGAAAYTFDHLAWGLSGWAVTDTGVAWMPCTTTCSLRTFPFAHPSPAATVAATTDGSGEVFAMGTRFVTSAVSGTPAIRAFNAGSAPTTVAYPAPKVPVGVNDFDLADGTLYTGDYTTTGYPIRKRSVSQTGSTPTVSTPSLLLNRSSGTMFAFGGDRGVARNGNALQFLDHGKPSGTAALPGQLSALGEGDGLAGLQISGPYAYAFNNGQPITAYDPTGRQLATVTDAHSSFYDAGQLPATFGARMVYQKPGSNALWLRDVSQPTSKTNPTTIVAGASCNLQTGGRTCSRTVAMWGDTVAYYTGASGNTINLFNLTTRKTRTVTLPTGMSAGQVLVGDGVLVVAATAAAESGALYAADLTKPTTTLVQVANRPVEGVRLDGRDLAWTEQFTNSAQPVKIARLPFGGTGAVRLLGVTAPTQLRTGGTWPVAFDTTKRLSSYTLTLTTGTGKVVRTLTGTAPDRGVRGLTWDGKDSAGKKLPAGSYRWTLTGTAADKTGPLQDAQAATAPSGVLTLA